MDSVFWICSSPFSVFRRYEYLRFFVGCRTSHRYWTLTLKSFLFGWEVFLGVWTSLVDRTLTAGGHFENDKKAKKSWARNLKLLTGIISSHRKRRRSSMKRNKESIMNLALTRGWCWWNLLQRRHASAPCKIRIKLKRYQSVYTYVLSIFLKIVIQEDLTDLYCM